MSSTPGGGLAFGSYLGAAFDEFPYGLALDGAGGLFVTGLTEAHDFPVSNNAFQPLNQVGDDAFLVKIGGSVAPPPPIGDFFVFLPMIQQ